MCGGCGQGWNDHRPCVYTCQAPPNFKHTASCWFLLLCLYMALVGLADESNNWNQTSIWVRRVSCCQPSNTALGAGSVVVNPSACACCCHNHSRSVVLAGAQGVVVVLCRPLPRKWSGTCFGCPLHSLQTPWVYPLGSHGLRSFANAMGESVGIAWLDEGAS